MQSFSFQRLVLLIKRDLGQNKKGYMITLGVLFSLYMFVVWFGRGVVSSSDNPAALAASLNIFIYYITLSGLSYVCSGLCADQTTRGGRIAAGMLPATNAERFASRFIILTFGYLLSAFLLYLITDGLWLLLGWILGNDYPSLLLNWTPVTKTFIQVDFNEGGYTVPSIVPTLFLFFSMFNAIASNMFASALFNKHPFMKIILLGFIIQFIVGVVVVAFSLVSPYFWLYIPRHISYQYVALVVLGLQALSAAVFFSLSYWLFCRKQVIQYRYF